LLKSSAIEIISCDKQTSSFNHCKRSLAIVRSESGVTDGE
jgi:hypothetical protein